MNRPDTGRTDSYPTGKIEKSHTWRHICVRTTFIVGFPGETKDDFDELKAFVAEQKFACAGVFTYSQEEGTVHKVLSPNQIDDDLKQDRYHELDDTGTGIYEIHQSEGKVLDVLVEGFDEENKNLACGRSYREASN